MFRPTSDQMDADVQIRLSGRFRIEGNFGPLEFDHEAPRDLVAFLLLNRQREYRRERVASELYGDTSTTDVSRKRLRNALWQLRSMLARHPHVEGLFNLKADTEWIGLQLGSNSWVDIDVIESAHAASVGLATGQADRRLVRQIEFAISQYRGQLLDGCTAQWCDWARDQLDSTYFALLCTAFSIHVAAGRTHQAIASAGRILRIDPAHELTHRGLMRLHFVRGDRTLALRQYERCAAALRRELDVAPSQQTKELKELVVSEALVNSTTESTPTTYACQRLATGDKLSTI